MEIRAFGTMNIESKQKLNNKDGNNGQAIITKNDQ